MSENKEGKNNSDSSSDNSRYGAWVDGEVAYLSKAKDVQPHVGMLDEKTVCKFVGGVDSLIDQYKEQKMEWDFASGMKNKVRKCLSCGKPNAYTLSNCNSCGTDISQTDITYTNNIFMGFVFGVEKGPFPFKISVRRQTSEFIVFDDLLALSPCHLNVIPTTHYIADFRYLLKNVKEGKTIVDNLRDQCVKTFKEQFWDNDDWRNKNIREKISFEEMVKHLITGFNFPPSQYQLHLQFMVPPLMPFHYHAYLKGIHFTKGRFIPYEYFSAITDIDATFETKDDTSAEEVFAFYKTHGVDYDKIWTECYDRYGASHRLLANWDAQDFEGVVKGASFYPHSGEKQDQDVSKLINDDKMTLQNYGRPYCNNNKPSGTFYKFAKVPSEVKSLL